MQLQLIVHKATENADWPKLKF